MQHISRVPGRFGLIARAPTWRQQSHWRHWRFWRLFALRSERLTDGDAVNGARKEAPHAAGDLARDSAAQPFPASFEAFYQRHERDIFGYLWRVCGDEQTANDLTQEVFFRAWRQFEQLRGYERPEAWLFRVATNLALNERRHQRIVGPAAQLQGHERAAGDHAAQLAERAALRAALLALPAQQRAAFILRELYGHSCAEIADILGVSQAAAKDDPQPDARAPASALFEGGRGMSAPATPTCPLGLTPDDLSAWRDHALSPDDERRITAHASGCPACQGVLAAHEALAAALRNEPAPAPDPRNWPRLHARISGERRSTPATPTFHRAQRPAVWGSLGAVAAVLLISTLFFHLFSQQAALRGASSHIATATATPVVTPSPISTHVAPTTPIAGTQLVWQTRRAPAGIVPIATGDTHHTNAFTFAPTDARTGYLCALTETTTSTVDIWATHDGAKTWSQTYHANLDRQWQACDLMIDAGDVMRVELALMRYIGPGKTTSVAMLSVDGGKTWRDIATDHDLTDLVTQGKASIGLMSVWPPSTGPGGEPLPLTPATYPHIVISSDGWRTQQPIDSGLNAQGIVATDVWQRPGDGALLAEGYLMTPPANLADALELWQSVDLGSHWTRVPTPTNLQPFSGYLVAQPQANAPWRVCGLAQLGHGVTQTGLVGCTQDAGQTWQARPLPVFTAVCGDTCSTGEELTEAEMLPDGSLLGLFTGRVNANGAQQDAPDGGLFLLAPHATQWKDIGSIPGGGVFVRGAPTAMLFSVGGSRTLLGEPAGSIIASSPLPDARDIAVATLP